MNEYILRYDKSVMDLEILAMKYLKAQNVTEYARLMGKAEGVRLAQSFADDEIKRLQLELALAALKNAGEQ